jgi:hypothetical protein
VIEELIRQQGQLQRQVDNLIKPEVGYDFISPYLGLPGLVGFWPMSSVQRSTGNVYDLSGQGRTLTYNGNPTFNIYNNIIPYIDLDGTGDYLGRADETDLDILGTESWAAVPGLTMGGWFYYTQDATYEALITKSGGAGQRGYYIRKDIDNTVTMYMSSDGTTIYNSGGSSTTLSDWNFVVGRFVPSTSIDIWNNNTKTSNTTSIPASQFNSSAPFQISGYNGTTQLLTGRASLCFLCANALPDALISSLFAQTRGLFGV